MKGPSLSGVLALMQTPWPRRLDELGWRTPFKLFTTGKVGKGEAT